MHVSLLQVCVCGCTRVVYIVCGVCDVYVWHVYSMYVWMHFYTDRQNIVCETCQHSVHIVNIKDVF